MALERTVFLRTVAVSMAVVLIGLTGTFAAPAGAAVSGTVIIGMDRNPLAGATIHLSDTADGRLVSSRQTRANGNFQIDRVETATYEVAVEFDGGLYLVGAPIRVEADEPLMLTLVIEKDPRAALAAAQARRGAGGLLSSPLAASLMVAGSAIAVGALIESEASNDSDPVASPFLSR